MKKIYCLLFAMLPLAAWAGEVKVTKPVLTLENDTLTLDFKFNMYSLRIEYLEVHSTKSTNKKRASLTLTRPLLINYCYTQIISLALHIPKEIVLLEVLSISF